jgi:hypothetical protein
MVLTYPTGTGAGWAAGGGERRPGPAIIGAMNAGEWVPSAIGLGLTFLFAVAAVAALGWWVLRGDRRNRELEESGPEQGAVEETAH